MTWRDLTNIFFLLLASQILLHITPHTMSLFFKLFIHQGYTFFFQVFISLLTHLYLYKVSCANMGGNFIYHCSNIGYCTFLDNTLISWCSKKQALIASNRSDIEYPALAHAIYDFLWIYWLLKDLKFLKILIALYDDNKNAIQTIHNYVFNECTKHIEIDYHLTRQHIFQGVLHLVSIETLGQPSNLFTFIVLATFILQFF